MVDLDRDDVYSDTHITHRESIRGGADVLRDKGLLDELHEAVADMATDENHDPGEAAKHALSGRGWGIEHTVAVGANRPRLDAFKDGVGIEHEQGEQMRVRSHLLFGEAMYRQDDIDVWVCIIRSNKNSSAARTGREFGYKLFTEHFPTTMPAYLIEYERTH